MSRKELTPYLVEVNRIARLLMAEWARVEPKHSVTLNPVSYHATFADMARKVVDDNTARGLYPPDHRPIAVRIEEMLREQPRRVSEVIRLLGVEHTTVIRDQVEDIIYDLIQKGKVYVHPTSELQWKAA